MKLYLSGIEDSATLGMVIAAGVKSILIDQVQYESLGNVEIGSIALDSGAYRIYKSGEQSRPVNYLQFTQGLRELWDFKAALDVIGNPDQTLAFWRKFFKPVKHPFNGTFFTPVYQWGAPRDHLLEYLDDRHLVGIGGLARLMRGGHREKDKAKKQELNDQRDAMLEELLGLCQSYPGRFHIFGINSLEAIHQLRYFAASGDTSKWLDGGRYGYVIFRHSQTGKLAQMPAEVSDLFSGMDREARCIYCAQSLVNYAAGDDLENLPSEEPPFIDFEGDDLAGDIYPVEEDYLGPVGTNYYG